MPTPDPVEAKKKLAIAPRQKCREFIEEKKGPYI